MESDLEAAESDVVIVGSGSAALSAALRAAVGGLRVTILEKTELLGGTSAMSGAGTWIPANHHARAAGIEDSVEEAIAYIRAASPEGWQQEEDDRWVAFARTAPVMLRFLEEHTPLRFALTHEPDIFAECPGGKRQGRMLSPLPLRKALLGAYAKKLRASTLPHLFTYHEAYDGDLYHHPLQAGLRFGHRLLYRLTTQRRGQGSALITGLLKGCLDNRCRIETGARVVELMMQPDGAGVAGVVAERGGVRRPYLARRGVVLATGGFEWDDALLDRYFPGPLDWRGSPRANEGDGQRLAASAGAALARMDQANIYPALPTRYEGRPHGIPLIFQAEPHAIVVDRNGRRFVSEYDYNIGEALDRRDPLTGMPKHLPAWVVADRRFLRQAPPLLWYARQKPNALVRASSLPELAAKIGLPPAALEQTVARFNGFCAAGRDLDFHRGESVWEQFKAGGPGRAMAPLEQPPFLAMPLNRSILGTKGGARTNERGQVLRPDGSVIPGLYAAGLAMANPIGTRAIGAGTTIGPNLTWGFICGESLLRDNRAL
ncbi:MAG TPA: FAD-dependent oxidoreductase [Stellaceae bacterium]|nr:FAD-dependent oxidoreductase [Stellaceae bacterium]